MEDDVSRRGTPSSTHRRSRRRSSSPPGFSPVAKRHCRSSTMPSSDVASLPPGPAASGSRGRASGTWTVGSAERPCRSVFEYECLNRIEEGTYGVVFRGREKATGNIVALKRLKVDKERSGFPLTALREVSILLRLQHVNIIQVKEVVVSSEESGAVFLVMEYVEHDLRSLGDSVKDGFLMGEIKTLMLQLLRALAYLHENWVMHRDLKPSNLLLSHTGTLKVCDFGLAREYCSPPKTYTSVVCTLWYRSPELLLGEEMYTTAIDIWSVGCILAELVQRDPLFPGASQILQIKRIFEILGTPNERIWPGWSKLKAVKAVTFAVEPFNRLPEKTSLSKLPKGGMALLDGLLTYDPKKRLSAKSALKHPFFKESPLPIDSSLFPTWPAKSELAKGFSRAAKSTSGSAARRASLPGRNPSSNAASISIDSRLRYR